MLGLEGTDISLTDPKQHKVSSAKSCNPLLQQAFLYKEKIPFLIKFTNLYWKHLSIPQGGKKKCQEPHRFTLKTDRSFIIT